MCEEHLVKTQKYEDMSQSNEVDNLVDNETMRVVESRGLGGKLKWNPLPDPSEMEGSS
jgi:hypothetical protein